jgi:tRNA threonylcarbamoyladenosine biosynthesis protein TsaE
MRIYQSFSSAATRKIGRMVAREVLRKRQRPIVALSGELGSGKTTFAQGFLAGLGVRGRVVSPTFVLARRFPLRGGSFKEAYHIDCYRIAGSRDFLKSGLNRTLKNPAAIFVVEWADRVKSILPARRAARICFSYGARRNERRISISYPYGRR